MARLGRSYPAKPAWATKGGFGATIFVWGAVPDPRNNLVGDTISTGSFGQYRASGSSASSWTSTGQPPGVVFNTTTGEYTGTTPTDGTFPTIITAINSAGSSPKSFNWVVTKVPPTWNSAIPNQSSQIGVTITSFSVASRVDGTSPFTWVANNFPPGIVIDPNTGVISGTPNVLATFASCSVTATNSAGNATSATFSWAVGAVLPVWSQPADQVSSIGQAITPVDFSAYVTGTPPITFLYAASTSPPAGLVLDSNTGIVTGTPTGPAGAQNQRLSADNTAVGGGLVLSPLFTWTINALPTWTAIPSQTSTTGTADTLDPTPYLSGTGPFTFAIPGPTPLPPGLSINPTTGLISGTPTTAGSYNPTILATNAAGGGTSAAFNWTVSDPVTPPDVAPIAPQSNVVGTNVSVGPFSVTGTGPFTWSATNLPSGLSINPSTGVVTGTAGGTPQVYASAIRATGPTSLFDEEAFNWTITAAPPAWNTVPQLSGVVGQGSAVNFNSYIQSGTAPITFTAATAMPPGTTLNSNGTVSGAFTTTGTFAVRITADNAAAGTVDSNTFNWVITAAPVWGATIPNQTSIVGDADTLDAATAGAVTGTPSITYALTAGFSLPAGLTLAPATGIISGTPTVAAIGAVAVRLTATNASGFAESNTFTWTTYQRVVWGTIPTQNTTVGSPAGLDTASFRTTNGSPAPTYAYGAGSTPPPEAVLNPTTGFISGTLVTAGNYSLSITATNAAGAVTSAAFAWNVSASAPLLTIGILSTNENVVNFSLNMNQFNSGGPATSWTKTVNPTTPWLSINNAGDLTGVVTTVEGFYSVELTATNGTGSDTDAFSLNVISGDPGTNGTMVAQSDEVGVNIVGRDFSGFFVGATSYIGLGLPTGLTCSAAGVVSGIPTVAQDYTNARIRGTNIHGGTTRNIPLWTITSSGVAPTWTPIPNQTGEVNSAVNLQVNATGTPPITYSADGLFPLPVGLVISSSGLITGNLPATARVDNVRIVAANFEAPGGVASPIFTWTITAVPAPPIFNAPPTFTYPENTGTLNLALAGYNTGGAATSWSILSGGPPGATIASNGVLTVVVTTREGTWPMTVRATNVDGNSDDTFNLIITSSNPVVIVEPTPLVNTLNDAVSLSATVWFSGATSYSVAGAPNQLPDGLTLNTSTGLISGNTTSTGLFNPTITATNVHGSTSRTIQWTVQVNPVPGQKRYGRVTPQTFL